MAAEGERREGTFAGLCRPQSGGAGEQSSGWQGDRTGVICGWRILQAKEREEEGVVLLGTQWPWPFPLDDVEAEAQWRQAAHHPRSRLQDPSLALAQGALTWQCSEVWRRHLEHCPFHPELWLCHSSQGGHIKGHLLVVLSHFIPYPITTRHTLIHIILPRMRFWGLVLILGWRRWPGARLDARQS